MTLVSAGIRIAQFVIKNRRALYKVFNYQDKIIERSLRAGGVSRASRIGVRHGALAGSTAGIFLNISPDTPGNVIQKQIQKQREFISKTYKPQKTRSGYSRRNGGRYSGKPPCDPRRR